MSKIGRAFDRLAFLARVLLAGLRYRNNGRRLVGRIVVEQIYFTGVQSLELIAALAILTGVVLAWRSISVLEAVGNLQGLSEVLITAIVREGGPLLTAVVITLRSGSAVAMEVGYMNVLGEIEGLEMQGLPVAHVLCVPRLLGVGVAVVGLMVLFGILAVLGGLWASWLVLNMTPWTYFYNLSITLRPSDFLLVLVKGICFGMVIPVVCMFEGLAAQRAITQVPPRVSRALVDCLIYVVIFNILISVAFSGAR